MTILELEDKLKARVEKAVEGLELKNKKGEYQSIKVIKGILPPENLMKRKDSNYEEFPFIMVRFHKISEENEAIAECKLFVGICAEEENGQKRQEAWQEENYQEGHHDLMTCISKIRQNFLSNIVMDGALIKKPFKAQCFLEQPYPYLYAEIDLKIEINTIDVVSYID